LSDNQKTSQSVLYLRSESIGADEISRLSALQFSDSGTRRLCLHNDELSELHVMLVEAVADKAFPRHMHDDGAEVIIVIEGNLELRIWNRGLKAAPTVKKCSGNKNSINFIDAKTFHDTRPGDGGCIYLEVKSGPFNPDALIFR
jgi:cupin fold WbuC family metalloprotein